LTLVSHEDCSRLERSRAAANASRRCDRDVCWALERLERRTHLSAAMAGTATGTVVYQYALAGGATMQVPLADWVVFDDVGNTGAYVAGDPVGVTNLQGVYTLSLDSASETIRVLPRAGWTTATGGIDSAVATPGATVSPFAQSMADPTVIDVLAAYTAASTQVAGPGGDGILGTLGSMFAYANQVQANSDTNIQINVINTVETNYSESGDFHTDLTALSSGGVGDVAAVRTASNADLTVMFESTDASGSGGEVGLAYEFSRARPNAAQGDAIVGLLGNLGRDSVTLAHELGHLLGADHDPAHATAAGTAPYARGYEFVGDDSVAYQDVMSYTDGTFLPYYSTPAAFYAGHVMGLTTNGDNARAVRQDGPAVARYHLSGDEGPAAAPADSTLVESVSAPKSGAVLLGSRRQSATVVLSNAGPAAATETATVVLSLDDGLADGSADAVLASATVPVRLGVGQGIKVSLPVAWPAGLASGSYQILAAVTANGFAAMASNGSGPTASIPIIYEQPTVDLSASAAQTLARGRAGRAAAVTLRLHNLGNTAAVGSATFQASALLQGDSSAGDEVALTLPPRRFSVPAGATRPVSIAFVLPAGLAPGTYLLSITLAPVTSPADLDTLDKMVSLTLDVL
jgi:hypothetical protein